eukprot:TRINITY_DN12703_c0_g1_i2.p1 TRINITY_DN12703_c0_g1~~TRINITY_DN12703_c0_g1_i2.p1  ORF type:complete len:1105 (+),score=418.28 TRINITY_DN12703_c0_g1_i2:87-3401(+)
MPTQGSPPRPVPEHGGIAENPLCNIFHLLSRAEDAALRRVRVPDTLVLGADGEPEWYYRHTPESGLRRSTAKGWSSEEVRRRFAQPPMVTIGDRMVPSPVCAVFVSVVTPASPRNPTTDRRGRAPPPLLSTDYLTPQRLAALFNRRRPQGILQRYSDPGPRLTVTQAVWTPFLMVAERRRCVQEIDDTAFTVAERTTTAAGSEFSEEVPLPAARQSDIEQVCRRIYSAALQQENVMVSRICVYFGSGLGVTFLWASSAAAMSGAPAPTNPPLRGSPPPQQQAAHSEASTPPLRLRDGMPSVTTTPAQSPASPRDREGDFDVQVLPFSSVGRWEEEPNADLVVYLTSDEQQRPDGYLVVPPGPDSAASPPLQQQPPRTAAQQQQLYDLAAGASPVGSRVAPSPEPSVSAITVRGSQGQPAARQIAQLAAGAALLSAAGVQSPHLGRRDGVHGVRQKYLAAAQAALLRDGGRSIHVGEDEQKHIPAPARKHVLKYGPVGGAGRPSSVKTRPASAPTSKLLAVLNVVAGEEDEGSPPAPELTQQGLEDAAARVRRQRELEQKLKAQLAPPHANGPPVDPPRAATAPLPKQHSARDAALGGDWTSSTLEATALGADRGTWLRPQRTVRLTDRALRARELQWNSSHVAPAMLLHMPRSFTRNFEKSRAWLYDLESMAPATGPQAVLLERQRLALRRQRRQEEQSRHAVSPEAAPRPPLQAVRPPPGTGPPLYPADEGSAGGLLSAARQEPTASEAGMSPQRAPRKLARKPLNSSGDQHQSLSEAICSQARRPARQLMQEAAQQRARMRSAAVAPHTQHSTLLDVLFAPRRDPAAQQQMEEQTSRMEKERRRQSEQRRDLEERAKRLEALRQKRQRLQQMREETKIRSQYSAIEAKYHNQLAVDFVEDILYQAYSRGLEAREINARGGNRNPGDEVFSFRVSREMWGSMQELHAMLVGLRFKRTVPEREDPTPAAGESEAERRQRVAAERAWEQERQRLESECPRSIEEAEYCVSADKVVLSNIMQELAVYKNCVERVFAQRDVKVIQRLKELIDTSRFDASGGQRGMPLFDAVKVIRAELRQGLIGSGDGGDSDDGGADVPERAAAVRA